MTVKMVFGAAGILALTMGGGLAAVAAVPADAAPCGLKRYVSLHPKADAKGDLTVPVKIDGTTYRMIFDPDSASSVIAKEVVEARNLSTHRRLGRQIIWDQRVSRQVTFSMVELGALRGKATMGIVAHPPVDGADGILGGDLLSSADVEVDPAKGEINLFAQDHCPGRVVYWSNSYATLPLQTDKAGHTYLMMDLDGKPLTVSLSYGLADNELGSRDAFRIFGIHDSSPGMNVVPGRERHGAPVHLYPFKTLTLGGLTIKSPKVFIEPQRRNEVCNPQSVYVFLRCYGNSQLKLGRHTLKSLHVFYAFKEKKLYVTAADPAAQHAAAKPN